jgi:hypothetical protein
LRTTLKKQSENISHILALLELIDIADFLAGVDVALAMNGSLKIVQSACAPRSSGHLKFKHSVREIQDRIACLLRP